MIGPLFLFFGGCLYLYIYQDQIIFMPRPLIEGNRQRLEKLPGVSEVELLTKEGYRIHGWVRRYAEGPQGVVIYFGGQGGESSQEVYGINFLAPLSFVSFNYRGYGLSEGRPSQASLVEDAVAIYDHVVAQPYVDPSYVILFGGSLGTGVAVQLAARRPVAGTVLVSPYDSLGSIGQHRYPWAPISWLLRHSFDSAAVAREISSPVLIVAGTDDQVIPSEFSRRLYEQWSSPQKKWILLPEADHSTVGIHPLYEPSIKKFIRWVRE